MKINHIIFDIGGVLIMKGTVDFKGFDKKFNLLIGTIQKIIDDCFKRNIKDKQFDVKEYFNKTHAQIIPFERYEEVTRVIYNTERLNQKLINWIKQRQEKYKFSVLSNNTAMLENILKKKFDIYHLFQKVFNSAEIRLTKPDPKIFHFITKELGASPKECLFIDDRLDNVQSASNVGFKAIQYTNHEQFLQEARKLELE